ncbi:hypothetical protein PPYR_12593 [Photinus pyralis]|uniref:HTH psq-type domain-containing protein n=1 Tax=Photinus pyralis TaxID=7054 RepID=A0A5N4A6N7_PHOPY|nr:hypothetical protein PPYR_12593 [Photinus pyralis]
MPRKYVRVTERTRWDENDMKRALKAVNDRKLGVRKAAKQFNVPYSTLWDKLKQGSSTARMGRRTVFTMEVELQIADHVKMLASMFYGLTKLELRRACYEFAEINQIKHPFNKERKLAGNDWYYGFIRRHSGISLRKPEPKSLNRINAFNKIDVQKFFENLKIVYEKHKFPPEKIFNVDETGITNVHVPQKVLAAKKMRRLGAITSGERGKNITVVCTMSASGGYVPPLFIYPRQRLPPHLCKDGPPGSIYRCSKSGWMTEDLFYDWLVHFSKHSHPSVDSPVLIIMDNHTTHTTLKAFEFCKENGIVVVSIPPHTSHRLQPLDVTFYGPLKTAYNQECGSFLKVNSYEKILQENVASLFTKAYNRVATIEKAVKGFLSTGIFPFNENIFPEEEYTLSQDQDQLQDPPIGDDEHQFRSATPENVIHDGPSTSGLPQKPPALKYKKRRSSSDSDSSAILEEKSDDEDFTTDKTIVWPISKISPVPLKKPCLRAKAVQKKNSIIFTATPNKVELEERERRRKNKEEVDKRKTVKVRLEARSKTSTETKSKTKSKTVIYTECNIQDNSCMFCSEFGKDGELWYACTSCGEWAHMQNAPM